MKLIYRPIEQWPGQRTQHPKSSPFEANWSSTLTLLDRELWQLHVTEAVLQVDSPNERDFRLDGQLRSDVKLRSGAVILSFETKRFGKLSYPCDRFTRRGYRDNLQDWQVNVRAIALGLEALRKIDRYGIANTGQQYTGWKQLGAGVATTSSSMTVEEAAKFVATYADLPLLLAGDTPWWRLIIDDPEARAKCFRFAAKRLHPDAGGDTEDFKRLGEAMDLLEATS